MVKIMHLAVVGVLTGLTACTPQNSENKAEKTEINQVQKSEPITDNATADNSPTIGTDGLIHIDTDKLKTGVTPADPKTYPYPFAIDSEPVKNYANEYKITAAQAQHAMTLSMASPEALNKVLDELIGEYKGYSLTDGADMSLVIFTSDKVAPAEFEYVIADKFGEGLVLPVKIVQASKQKAPPQVGIHAKHDSENTAEQ